MNHCLFAQIPEKNRSSFWCSSVNRKLFFCQENFKFKWVNTPRLEKKFPSGWKNAKNELFS